MDTGDTAWVLASAGLVLFMTPGLALFYGGLVRSKHVLAAMMQSVAAIGIVSILLGLGGDTPAFGHDVGGGVGGPPLPGLPGGGGAPSPFAAPAPPPAAAAAPVI